MTICHGGAFPKDRTLLTPSPESTEKEPNQFNTSVLESGTFGTIKVIKHLGSGVSGSVFSGQTEQGINCVVKRYLKGDASFKRELTVYKVLNKRPDASFVKMLCSEESPEIIVLASTPTFTTLDAHAKNPSPEFLSRMAICLTRGLVHLKQIKILHRDLKPENILVDEKGLAKIIDFGHAYYLGQRKCPTKAGSWLYSCPAANLGVPYGTEGDAWSLGVIVEEYVTGKEMFSADACRAKTRDDIRVSVAAIHREHIGEDASEEFQASPFYPEGPIGNRKSDRREEFLKQFSITRGIPTSTIDSEGWSRNRNLLLALAHLADQCLQWHLQPIESVFEDLKRNIIKS